MQKRLKWVVHQLRQKLEAGHPELKSDHQFQKLWLSTSSINQRENSACTTMLEETCKENVRRKVMKLRD